MHNNERLRCQTRMGEQLVEGSMETLAVIYLKRSRTARMSVEAPQGARSRVASRPRPVFAPVTRTVARVTLIRKRNSKSLQVIPARRRKERSSKIRFHGIWSSHEQLAVMDEDHMFGRAKSLQTDFVQLRLLES